MAVPCNDFGGWWNRKMQADDAGGADVTHAQRLLKALGMGQVHEIVSWSCARYLADMSTSAQM